LVESGDVTSIVPAYIPWWIQTNNEEPSQKETCKIVEISENEAKV